MYFPAVPPDFQRYDVARSYQWNYTNAPPLPDDYVVAPTDQNWQLCGQSVNSPIAIAAGPLLNGRWVLHYAALGFDVLTYKTVRSRDWPCYELPNLQPVDVSVVNAPTDSPVSAAAQMSGSWAVSFGMPSASPDLWRFDIEETRRLLPRAKKLSVSVVATPDTDWSINEIAEDYAQCAGWAVQSGADFIELNFSCPNVATCDGQLYQNPDAAATVTRCVRQRIGQTPLLLKIGHVADRSAADALVQAVGDLASGLVMINCIPSRVTSGSGLLFDGQPRGIAGPAIRSAVLTQTSLFRDSIVRLAKQLDIVAVGGLSSIADVEAALHAGASGCQLATVVMT